MAVNKVPKDKGRIEAERALFQRQNSYRAVFDKESPTVLLVLEDLAKFCRAHSSTFDTDGRVHALQEGRREVFLRITEYLELPSQKLWELKTGTKF